MSKRVSVVLLLLSLLWIEPAGAQRGPQDSASWFLSVRGGQLTASSNRIPLRLVLEEELVRQVPVRLSVSEGWREHRMTARFRALPLEWTVALQHPDKDVRLDALQRWAGQGAATPLDPVTHALVDPDESVRARAQELVERVWAAKAGARERRESAKRWPSFVSS